MSIKVFEKTEFINEINNVNLNQRLIKYSLFMKFIINNSKEEEIIILAKSIYEKSREIPSGALTAIFTDPSFGFWLYISKCIENRLINKEIIPKADLPHMDFLNENDDFLYYHLIDLNRWILGACMLSKLNFESLIIIRNQKLYIPIMGIVFDKIPGEFIQNVKFVGTLNQSTIIINQNEYQDLNEIIKLANTGGISNIEINNIYITPSLLMSGGKILLDHEDPIITNGWSSLYKNPDGTKYILTSRNEVLDNYKYFFEASKLIHENWPEIAFNISKVLQNIHVIESPYTDKHVSCTAANYYGSILVSFGNEYLLAEAIVHEYSHNLLNMIIANGDMFDGEIPNEEIYYSPWRNDPRHISGLLHAVFVFNNVGKLLDKILKTSLNEFVYERILNTIVKLIMGIKILKEYEFKTDFARNFIHDLEDDINELKNKYIEKDLTIKYEIQLEHLKIWMKNNPDLIIDRKILKYS
jgi:hypothetical protein